MNLKLSFCLFAVSTLVGVVPYSASAAVEYVRVCSAIGPKFQYLPDSDTKCINPATGEIKTVGQTGTENSELRQRALKAQEGVALSLALPGAVVDPGHTFGAAVNLGTFDGSTGIGVSGAIRANSNFTVNGAIGAGLDSGAVGGRAGVNVSW